MLDSHVQRTALGDVLKLRLRSAPFPHASRQNGYRYHDTQYQADPHYVDSTVAVFIPPGIRRDLPVNLVFFFHGWNSSVDDVQQRFDLYRQFAQSGVPALLVLPELAWNAPDSSGGKLEDPGGFTRMVTELLEALRGTGEIGISAPGNIVLAGHSGAYRVIAQILTNADLAANVKEVWLFDALYDFADQYGAWIDRAATRFVSISASDGEQTTDVDKLIASLREEGVACDLERDDPLIDPWTLHSRVVFLKSDTDHFGVVAARREFRRLLETSPALAAAPPAIAM
ncbi:MAG TPA: hypothetical protein VFH83_02650 [Spirochaetia bacterium]|nr:hypothetical protein [Spirochaetia bacterium]